MIIKGVHVMELCKICGGKIKETELQCRLIGENGKHFCTNCASNIYVINKTKDKEAYDKRIVWFNKCMKSDNISEDTKTLLKSTVVHRSFDTKSTLIRPIAKTGWKTIVKFLTIIPVIVFGIIGFAIGGVFAGYGDDKEFFMAIGAVIGIVVGCVLVATTMLFIEMAENIAASTDLLNEIKHEIKKK